MSEQPIAAQRFDICPCCAMDGDDVLEILPVVPPEWIHQPVQVVVYKDYSAILQLLGTDGRPATSVAMRCMDTRIYPDFTQEDRCEMLVEGLIPELMAFQPFELDGNQMPMEDIASKLLFEALDKYCKITNQDIRTIAHNSELITNSAPIARMTELAELSMRNSGEVW